MSSDWSKVTDCILSSHSSWKSLVAGIRLHETLAAKCVYQLQCDRTSSGVSRREIACMCRGRKANSRTDVAMERNQIDAIAHLGHTVMSGVDERISCIVAHAVECFDHLLHDVVATVVQYIGHILHQKRER